MMSLQKTRLPSWIKTKIPSGNNFSKVYQLLKQNSLHSVCEEARCPNIGECYNKGTSTFILLGNVCTRNCEYCNIESGKPESPNREEPQKIASVVKKLNLRYVVLTSVTRDDLKDGGANHFAKTVDEIKKESPDCKIELLIPDFKNIVDSLQIILKSKPDVINHNIETVKKIFTAVRPEGDYHTSLGILKYLKQNQMKTKSGFMIGLGETFDEIKETISDLKRSKIDILTIGQYLKPKNGLVEVKKYYTPDEFIELKKYAQDAGIKYVLSGPLVRSSYNADSINI